MLKIYKKIWRVTLYPSIIALTMIMTVFSSFSKLQVAVALSSKELKAQVDALQADIEANKNRAKELASQTESLKKTIAGLDIQIAGASSQINLTTLKITDLTDKLDKAQIELDRQKELLKTSMRALYKRGGASSIELLASSDSFSSFINDQEYLERLKTGIQHSAEAVITLKQRIQSQKDEQQNLLKQQQDQKRALDITKNSRSNLLEQTQGEEARYQSILQDQIAKQKEINKQLFAQIQLEAGSANKGGYPYTNSPFSMIGPGCQSGDGPDRWGYCTRQCVSYTAWAVERSGRRAPYGYGNARDWVQAARSEGVPVSTVPKAGDVAIYTGGSWGHAQYVDSVNNEAGTMRISQYNALLDGQYSEATVYTDRGGWYYLHFP